MPKRSSYAWFNQYLFRTICSTIPTYALIDITLLRKSVSDPEAAGAMVIIIYRNFGNGRKKYNQKTNYNHLPVWLRKL